MKPRQPRYGYIFAAHEDSGEIAEFARKVWAETISDLEDRGLLTKARAAIIDRYVRTRAEYEFLYPIAMHEGPCRKSESGGEYANMKWSAVGKLNEQIMKLEASLLLTPQSTGDKGEQIPASPPASAKKYLDRSKCH